VGKGGEKRAPEEISSVDMFGAPPDQLLRQSFCELGVTCVSLFLGAHGFLERAIPESHADDMFRIRVAHCDVDLSTDQR